MKKPPPVKPTSELEGVEPVAPNKAGAPRGNTNGADAAKFKRETLERLRKMRQDGLTIAQIVSASRLEDGIILDVLAAKRVPISDYRKLAAALDQIEKEEITRT